MMSKTYNSNSSGRTLTRTMSRRELLLSSAMEGNWSQTIEVLRHMPDSVIGKQGELLLHEAVKQSQLPMIDLLIERGIDPLATDVDGCTILHLASKNGHEHIVQHLLSQVPDLKHNINQVSHHGMTAYDLAGDSAHVQSVLQQNGAVARNHGNGREAWGQYADNNNNKGYKDWPEVILNAQYHLEDSCVELKKQVHEVSQEMQKAFAHMYGIMKDLVDIQTTNTESSDEKLNNLKKQLNRVEKTVKKKTENLSAGVSDLTKNAEDIRISFKQASEFNDYVYFRIFNKISQKLGLQKGRWKGLCNALLHGYPKVFVEGMQKDIEEHHTKEEDMAYECLSKWHVYNHNLPNKIDKLKDALTKCEAHVCKADIDVVLQEYKKEIPREGVDVVSDSVLMDLADNIGNEWLPLGISLGYSAPQLENLKSDNQNSKDRNFSLLWKWRDRQEQTKSTIIARLIEAFKSVGRNDLVVKLQL